MRYSSTKLNRNPHSSQVAEQNGKGQPLETALRETQTRLKLLNSIFTGIKSSMSVEQIILCTLKQLHRYFPQVRVAYSTLTPQGRLSVISDFEPQKMRSLTGQVIDLTLAPEYLKALQNLTPVVVQDVSLDHRLLNLSATIQASGTRAFLSLPLKHSEQLVGVLCFDSPTPKRWSEYEMITLQEVASYLEVAIGNTQAQQALQRSEERWQLALRGSNDGVWDWDIRTNEAYFSPRWKSMLGYEDQDISDQLEEWKKRVHPDDLAWVSQAIQDHFAQKTPFYRAEHRIQCKDGSYKWILARGQALWNEIGDVVRMAGSHTDITERRELEVALYKSHQALEQRVAERTVELKQVNANLAKQEALYRTLAHHIPNGAVILFDRDLRYLLAEGDDLEPVGLNRQEMIGKTVWEIFPAETCATIVPLYRAALAGEAIVEEVSYQGRIYQLHLVPVRNEQGEIFAGMVLTQNITARALAEAALQETTAILNAINESTPTSIFVKDLQGQYLMANPAFLRVIGKTATDVIGKTDLECLANREQAEEFMANDRQVMETGQALAYEEKADSPEGGRVYLSNKSPYRDSQGNIIGLIGIATDITDRKVIEDSLRESEAFSRNVIESTADCVKVLTAEGLLLSMNRYGRCLMEIDDFRPLVHQPWLSFWPESYQQVAREAINSAQAGQLGHFQGFCPTFKGTPKWWDVVVTPVLDTEGKVKLLLSTSRDITEIRRAEAEREKVLQREQVAREEAETANRLKDEFLAILSHELRTPLNPILGWSQLLQAHKFSEEKTQDALATIERNAKLQIQLIEDLLDISRILRGKLNLDLGVVDLVHPTAGAIETVRLAAEAKSIQIEAMFETDVEPVKGDSGRLQQIVWNLLSNAVKFTPNGGSITVKLLTGTGNCPSSPLPYAEIQVIDTGEGISPEFLPFVFESFRQQDSSTTRRFGGLGLGLAIVRQLVEAHGGTVSVSSAGKGHGAMFKVCLPLVAVCHLSPSEPSSFDSSSDLQNLRVLLVDDDPDSLKLLAFILEQEGAMITAISSAAEALECLMQKSFDVLVSDIGMPEMDGYKLLRQVRMLPNGANLKTLAVTAFASERDQKQALSAGYQKHISKPIQPQKLINAIATLKG